MKVSDIRIQPYFERSKPSPQKLDFCRKYFKENGRLDSDIVVDQDNTLIDGYIRYLVLLENDVKEIDIVRKQCKNRQIEKTYVYGRHPNNKKEYVWRVPKKLKDDNIAIGEKVLVATKYGVKPITVTKIEKLIQPPSSSRIRKVIRCLKN